MTSENNSNSNTSPKDDDYDESETNEEVSTSGDTSIDEENNGGESGGNTEEEKSSEGSLPDTIDEDDTQEEYSEGDGERLPSVHSETEESTEITEYEDSSEKLFVQSQFVNAIEQAATVQEGVWRYFREREEELTDEQRGAAEDLFEDSDDKFASAEGLFDHTPSGEGAEGLFDHDRDTEGAEGENEFSDFSGQSWDPDKSRGPSPEEEEDEFTYEPAETEADEPQTEEVAWEGEQAFEEVDITELLSDPVEGDKREGYTDEFEGYVEEKRYWLYKPYSYAVILRSTEDDNRIYHVVEPELDEYEEILKRELGERLRDMLRYEEIPELEETTQLEARERVLRNKVLDVVSEYGISKDSESLHKVLYYVERDFIRYGKIDPIMNDPYIEDINCNGYDVPIYVYHREHGGNLESNITFKKQELNSFVIRLAQRSGKHISTANPQVDASLPDGSRAQLTLGEDVTTRGSAFTIRKFKEVPLTPVDLVDLGTFSVEQMAYFWLAIENRKSLIFAGGTASGKTTSMNAISLFIPPDTKIVSIEDTRELTLPHENWLPSVTRQKFGGSFGGENGENKGEVTMYKLLRAALRQRPEYLLVGEVRGEEANTLFQAMSTGHTTYSTFHADDVDSVIQRLTNKPIEVPRTMLKSLDIISIQTQRDVNGEKVRRNIGVSEVGGLDEDNNLETYAYYNYDARDDVYTDTGNSRVLNEIAETKGWTDEQLRDELAERERILQYMIDNNIRGYRAVTRILQAYMVDPERILKKMDDGTLSADDLQRLDSVI